jgi:tetratricopeptide (TPR) repeat protein
MKRYEEARTILKKAAELDPLSVPINTDIGFSLFYSGDNDAAIEKLNVSLAMNPNFGLAHLWLGRVYQEKKMLRNQLLSIKEFYN